MAYSFHSVLALLRSLSLREALVKCVPKMYTGGESEHFRCMASGLQWDMR